jgi:uroporphyrinogen decarboxylase
MTVLEPDLLHTVLEKCTVFLTDYVKAFRSAGADGVIMAEPVAGLLSPPALATFSSAYVKIISDALADFSFAIILHNCGANPHHLEAILESGVKAFHFGAPMDMVEALEQIPSDVVLCGNLDPSGVFCRLPPGEVTARTESLLKATAAHRNFVLSSGCDLPPNAPLASLDAFFAAGKSTRIPSANDRLARVAVTL